jgi:hypothetical protein
MSTLASGLPGLVFTLLLSLAGLALAALTGAR